MVMVWLLMLSVSSTMPLAVPFLSNDSAGSSGLDDPNKANSIARRMVDFPEPMSPANKIVPSGKEIVSSK